MGRAECLVVTCSVIIIAVFAVFCFLMSTVNPPRFTTDAPSRNTPAPDETANADTNKFVNFYFRNNLDASEDTEKVNGTEINTPALVPFYPHRRANLLPSIQYKNPNLVKVYPPIWMPVPAIKPNVTGFELSRNVAIKQSIPTYDNTSQATTRNTIVHSTTTNPEIKDNVKTSENTTKLPLIQRRSVNVEKKVDKDTGAVILRILDDYGKSRIEIKLYPNEVFQNKQMRKHRSSRKEKTHLNIAEDQSDDDKDTEIKILPNSTVIINNQIHWIDNRNIHKPVHNKTGVNFNTTDEGVKAKESHFTSKKYNDKVESINADVTRQEKYSPGTDLNSTSTESLVLKVIFDNVTTSFADLNHNVSNDLTVFELK